MYLINIFIVVALHAIISLNSFCLQKNDAHTLRLDTVQQMLVSNNG